MKRKMDQMVPDGSEGGNTTTPSEPKKFRISPSVRWCFTHNNYTEEEVDQMVQDCERLNMKYVMGREVGPKGTPHIQGFVESGDGKTKFRPMETFKWPWNPHWKKCKGNKIQNANYCSKDGNYRTNIKIRKKLTFPPMDKDWEIEVLDILKNEPDDRTIYWYWSKEGNIGKTTFTKYLCVNNDACLLSGKGADVRNGALTWLKDKGYYPDLCIFPIPRSINSDYLSYEAIENIKDACFYSGKYEGGTVCEACPHLFVFANFPPDEARMSSDRWVIKNIDDLYSDIGTNS